MKRTFQSGHKGDIYLRRDKDDPYSFFLELKHEVEYRGKRWERFLILTRLRDDELDDLFGSVDSFLDPGQRKLVQLQLVLIDTEDSASTADDNGDQQLAYN